MSLATDSAAGIGENTHVARRGGWLCAAVCEACFYGEDGNLGA